jgi:hypothetical protein
VLPELARLAVADDDRRRGAVRICELPPAVTVLTANAGSIGSPSAVVARTFVAGDRAPSLDNPVGGEVVERLMTSTGLISASNFRWPARRACPVRRQRECILLLARHGAPRGDARRQAHAKHDADILVASNTSAFIMSRPSIRIVLLQLSIARRDDDVRLTGARSAAIGGVQPDDEAIDHAGTLAPATTRATARHSPWYCIARRRSSTRGHRGRRLREHATHVREHRSGASSDTRRAAPCRPPFARGEDGVRIWLSSRRGPWD